MSATTEAGSFEDHTTGAPPEVDLTAGRRQVARSRGALSGALLIVLGAWAALAPFIGPYFDFGLTPRPNDAWHWTPGRGLYELLPGGITVLAGLVLLLSASRLLTLTMAWLAVLSGAWLVIGPTLASKIGTSVGSPNAVVGSDRYIGVTLALFLALGAAIVLVSGAALGRLSVHSVRDVRAAERRAEQEAAEERRLEAERVAAAEAAAAEQDHRRAAEEQEARALQAAQRRQDEPTTEITTAPPDPADGQERIPPIRRYEPGGAAGFGGTSGHGSTSDADGTTPAVDPSPAEHDNHEVIDDDSVSDIDDTRDPRHPRYNP